jgi:two-component system response regulator FlrC
LIVDDEVQIREGLASSLVNLGFEVTQAGTGEEALAIVKSSPDLRYLVTDYRMPGMDGLELLKESKRIVPDLSVVMITAYGSVNHAIEAIQSGADNYLCKPFSFKDLEKVLVKTEKESGRDSTSILTKSPAFKKILAKAERAAKSPTPILIEGPSGTGKELLARQIHDWSDRRNKAWVAVNCAALPAGLLESELFGFERGAFTGANERRAGKFELADGGTLLLDEIGELDLLLQAKLLRVLQESEVDRIGSRKPQKVNVRIIATTNRNLESLVRKGLFREDLYFRLYGVRLSLPALKDRPEDIAFLAEEFLRRQKMIQGRDLYFDSELLQKLNNHSWSGNVRELEKSVERAAVLSETGKIEWEHFEIRSHSEDSDEVRVNMVSFSHPDTNRSMKEMEKEIILQALSEHQGNRTHTAKALGMSLRTLRHKLKLYRDEGEIIESSGQVLPSKNLQCSSHDAPLFIKSLENSIGEKLALKGDSYERN